MKRQYPFGEVLRSLAQEDQTPKRVFVLGVYASAVHAEWTRDGRVVCKALAVASEPRIFWNGDPAEAEAIISRIPIPGELGTLKPADRKYNGPSAKVLEEHILAPLGFARSDAWLCDCLPESRLDTNQLRAIRERYDPLVAEYGLNPVTVPRRTSVFCSVRRAEEIADELMRSEAGLLLLLGDIPIRQFLNRVSNVPYQRLQEYVDLYGYGNPSDAVIHGKSIPILPLAHPRQIGGLGQATEKWRRLHAEWERGRSV